MGVVDSSSSPSSEDRVADRQGRGLGLAIPAAAGLAQQE